MTVPYSFLTAMLADCGEPLTGDVDRTTSLRNLGLDSIALVEVLVEAGQRFALHLADGQEEGVTPDMSLEQLAALFDGVPMAHLVDVLVEQEGVRMSRLSADTAFTDLGWDTPRTDGALREAAERAGAPLRGDARPVTAGLTLEEAAALFDRPAAPDAGEHALSDSVVA